MAITYTPTYPVVGDEITLAITSATGSTDATQFALTSVPDRSSLDLEILVDANDDPVQTFVADAAGVYGIKAYDYRRFSGGAAYPGDPAGEARDELVAVQTGSVYVADEMLLPIAGAGHSITLRWLTLGGTVVDASLVSPTTEKARQCALDSTVLAAVAALEGVDPGTVGETLVADVVSFISKFGAHIADVGPHYAADTVNTIAGSTITTQAGAIVALNDLADKFLGHAADASGVWHHNIDRTNYTITAKASDVATATVKLVDMRRVYAAHISTTTGSLHKLNDTTNTNTADTLLTVAVKAILNFFASAAPTTPTGENPATVSATARYGFKLA